MISLIRVRAQEFYNLFCESEYKFALEINLHLIEFESVGALIVMTLSNVHSPALIQQHSLMRLLFDLEI